MRDRHIRPVRRGLWQAGGAIALMGLTLTIGRVARAQDLPPPEVTNGLFPSSSEDFFEGGVNRMEGEIQRMQYQSASEPILRVNENVEPQRDQWLPEKEAWALQNGTRIELQEFDSPSTQPPQLQP